VDFPLAIHDRFRSTTCGFYSPTTQSIGSLSTFSSIVFVAEKSGHDFLYPTRKMEGLEVSIEPTAQAPRIFLAYGRIFFVHLSLAGVVFTTAPIDQ